jgi:hypothetical protein
MSRAVWGCALAALLGCSPQPRPPPTGDACEAACERRAELGCLEPQLAATCIPVCEKSAARGLFKPMCAALAEDVTDMERCNVRCGR